MNATVEKARDLLEVLPDDEQKFALEFIKKLVLAWDPDYTKVTKSEAERLDRAMEEFKNGEVVDSEDINWD
ncbi:hypothetical protein KQI85_07240 [Falcatimonas sp. MSJ-15]|uniref:hypothetical protein n=1 Tax=Falcatimonas sp. MSJ-15 TaxID=2841515 RepID=UPI001C11B032|nr:hypothetical protein [Falcatimonas sp. MSJ-15]MBU5470162.1 hypothetical protein [Falcatimonas sp. MSJ-15]